MKNAQRCFVGKTVIAAISFVCLCLLSVASPVIAQDFQWAWMKGAKTTEQAGNYGLIGESHQDHTPGARVEAVSWTDSSGRLWLFGGWGRDGAANIGLLNDLWKYDPISGNWIWMKGAKSINESGTYGILENSSPANVPGARTGAVSWTDNSDNLWLFGGFGKDGAGKEGNLNDLWKYNVATGNWTWMKGAKTTNQSGTYGKVEIPDPDNTPGARYGAVAWSDHSGKLWLFGGQNDGYFSDLWQYNPSTGNWTWMKGPFIRNQSGNYGTSGVPDPDNTPGGRHLCVSWTDGSGRLWLFGGFGLDSQGDGSRLNDLWKYDITSGNWTWMKGASTTDQVGVYGSLGAPDPNNTPGARYDAVSWTDGLGGLWLFGGFENTLPYNDGYSFNDLWEYNTATGNWTWMKGASTTDQPGTYGTMGTFALANTPGARNRGVSWTDNSGRLWLFGGWGRDGAGSYGYLNDLWLGDSAAPVNPVPDIKANNSDTAVAISTNDTLSVTVSLDPGNSAGSEADWWIATQTPFGLYFYYVSGGILTWGADLSCIYQGPLLNLDSFEVLNIKGLPTGSYTFYFAVDMDKNGVLNPDGSLYFDSVLVDVQ